MSKRYEAYCGSDFNVAFRQWFPIDRRKRVLLGIMASHSSDCVEEAVGYLKGLGIFKASVETVDKWREMFGWMGVYRVHVDQALHSSFLEWLYSEHVENRK